ncbi:MAG: peptidylprolyl isomerase [Synechococcus sp.]
MVVRHDLWGASAYVATSAILIFGLHALPAAALPQGNVVSDGQRLLRMGLPFEQKDVRFADEQLSEAEEDIRRVRSLKSAQGHASKAKRRLERQESRILAAVPEEQQAAAMAHLVALKSSIDELEQVLEDDERDLAKARIDAAIDRLTSFEQDFVSGFPFEIPSEYDNLPRLLGRAQAEFNTTAGRFVLTLDGYNAPLSAGNIADLVDKGFYDGLGFDRVEDFFLVQLGDPPGDADGYIDPSTRQKRTIPLEIRARGDELPLYEVTFDQAGYVGEEPMIPFYAQGTLALATYDGEPNSASSQFFIFLAEPELTPAGLNLLDGNFATFGYVTEGVDDLRSITLDDKVISAKMISGTENLVR